MTFQMNDNLINDNTGYLPLNAMEYNNADLAMSQIDNELKRLLIDEKDRNEQLKKYYEALKTDYARAQGEVLDLQNQLRHHIDENKIVQEKYKTMFEKMQQELKKKQINIEDLKSKELDEVKLEKLKEELSQQIEMPYKDIVKQFEQELERLQEECNKLRYENSYLKSNGEHEKNEFQALTQQFKLKHDVELTAIRKDRDILRQKLQEINHTEAHKLREILKENNHFKVKMKSLIEENDELRTKIERTDSYQNSLIRSHSKIETDYTAKISLLESEKESVKLQNENMHKEMFTLNETIANNIRKIHDLERENIELKNYIEEVQHNAKKEIANIKLAMVKEKGEYNRQKESLLNKIEDLETKLEISETNLHKQKLLVDEKEREVSKSINAVHEENWAKISELTNEKLDLESRLQIAQKDLEYKTNILQADKEKCDEKMRLLEKQRDEIYRENNRLRILVGESENIRNELEKEQEKKHDLQKKIHTLETEIATNNGLEQELTEINLKLKNELVYYNQEAQKAKEHLKRMKEEFEERLSDMKAQYISEKTDYQLKNDELQIKFNKLNNQMNESKAYFEKKKKQYQIYLKRIKTKSELVDARLNELKIREQALKNCVPIEVHNKLKKQLQDILKKHQNFRHMLSMNQPVNFSSLQNDILSMNMNMSKINVFENEFSPLNIQQSLTANKNEIDKITSRLDNLTNKQNEHLKQLTAAPLDTHTNTKSPCESIREKSPNLSIISKTNTKPHIEKTSQTSDSESSSEVKNFSSKANKNDGKIMNKSDATNDQSSSESYEDDFDTSKSSK